MSATVVGKSSELLDLRVIARLAQIFDAGVTYSSPNPIQIKEGLTKDLFDKRSKWFQEASMERRMGCSKRKAGIGFTAVISIKVR
jgi:hypothetical protein